MTERGCQEIVAAKQFGDQRKFWRDIASLKTEIWDGRSMAVRQCTRNLSIQTGAATTTVRSYKLDWIAYNTTVHRL